MERLKTTTILITSLALAVPAPGFAESSNAALKACIAAHIEAGESRVQALAACSGQTGEAKTKKSAEPKAPPPQALPKAAPQKLPKAAPVEAPKAPVAQQNSATSLKAAEQAAQEKRQKQKAAKEQAAQQKAAQQKAAQEKLRKQTRAANGAAPAQPDVTQPGVQQPGALSRLPAQPGAKQGATTLPGAKTPPARTVQPPAATQPPVTAQTPVTAQPAQPPQVPLLPGSKIGKARQNGTTTAVPPATTPATGQTPSNGLMGALAAANAAKQGQPVTNEALSAPVTGAAPDAGPMQEEVITRDNSRRSSQDFSTLLDGRPRSGSGPVQVLPGRPLPGQPYPPAPPVVTKKKKDKGLSDVEKLAIAGIAALAVGALLSNGSRVAANTGDRVVVQNPDGSYRVIKDDNALLRQPGSTIRTQDYADGSSRTVVTKPDGSQIITVYDAQRRIVQRVLVEPNGRRYVLIDDSRGAPPVRMSSSSGSGYGYEPSVSRGADEDALRAALAAQGVEGRRYTLSQIRDIGAVRALAPVIGTENITFASGSSAISPDQAHALAGLGATIRDEIAADPRQIFLIEGHTDAVGDPAMNLTLSDRRAESLALALSEYFDVPAENLVVQGYGEEELAVQTARASEANRRVVVRRITDLLQVAQE